MSGIMLKYDVCEDCIYEAILQDIPDYRWEEWGKRPIWAEYSKRVPKTLCVVCIGDDVDSICLEHLLKKGIYSDK